MKIMFIIIGFGFKMIASDKILKAKVHLQKKSPFFAYLVMNMRITEMKEIGSMGVDKKGNCYYNTDFVDKLSLAELQGVLAHEVLHIILEHLKRGTDDENKQIRNISDDMVVNDLLVENDFELPSCDGGALIPSFHSCDWNNITIDDLNKKTAIQVYNEIMEKLSKEEQGKKGQSASGDGDSDGDGNYKGSFDKHIKGKSGDKDETNEALAENQEKWKRALGEASAFARSKGDMPSGLGLLVDDLLKEKIDWRSMLYKYITKTLPFDYTYARPSKKSVSCGVYMPSILRESVEIVVSVDTSGSINRKELTEFLSEIKGIEKSFNNINMKVIVCDCDIKDVYSIGNGQEDDLDNIVFRGGGGTDHNPIYEYIHKNLPNTQFLINFTDGYTSIPEEEEIKTLWVVNSGGSADWLKWGEVIHLD